MKKLEKDCTHTHRKRLEKTACILEMKEDCMCEEMKEDCSSGEGLRV